MSDFFNSGSPYYLCIKTEPISLGTSEPDESDARTTEVLSSFVNTTNFLDIYDDTQKKYVFTGLLVSTTDTGAASLVPFMQGADFFKIHLTSTDPAEKIGKYYGTKDTDTLTEITDDNVDQIPADAQFYVKSETYKVNSAALPITSLLDVGGGKYSLRMIEDITEQGTNTTVASGDYSVALGLGTAATGEASTALGNNTEASAEGAFAAGNNTKASEEGAVALGSDTTASGPNAAALGDTTVASGANSVALGSNTTANEANQVVIGQYNDYTSDEAKDQAFIIANGESDIARSNKFTVSKTGDVKALGTLETKGSIKATGDSNNDLELGTINIKDSYGSIKIFGKALPAKTTDESGNEIQPDKIPVFQVADTGATTIAGAMSITNDTQSDSTTSGALKVSGGVGVGGNLNVRGTASITGKTTLGDVLEVTGATALKSTLNVSSNTTIDGTATIAGATTINNNITVTGTANFTGNTTLKNDLIVEKNASVTGDTTIAGKVKVTDTALASGTTAALIVSGGEIIGNNLIIKGETDSTSTTAGALVVRGGVGIGNKLCVGGATTLNDNLTVADGKTTTLGGITEIKGDVKIASTTDYSKADNGTCSAALVVDGGTYIAKKLHVAGDTTFYENLEIGSERVIIKKATQSTATNNGALTVVGGVGIGGNLNVAGSSNIAGNLTLAGTSGRTNTLQLGNESTSNKGGELKIYGTGTTEVFSVANTGATDIGGNLTVAGVISGGNKLSIGSGTTAIEISSTGITGLSGLTVSGQINATVFNATSDARLKTNINNYKFEKSITSLPIKQFEYIKDETHTKYIGCLAQDLQEICPELVNENPDGTLSIQESKLVYALLQEVKELKEKVDQLERR